MKLIPAAAIALVLLIPTASAALKVGDPAPKLSPGEWVKGEPVTGFEGDKVYMIEFWATWCGPCVAAIPHINDIYRKHKDKGLVVIGQNLGEDLATVKGFAGKMGAKMSYRVTSDDDKGTMGGKWLKAAGQNGIPCAFVVNKKGRIAYIGHPMSMDESLIPKLLAEPSEKSGADAKPAAPATPGAEALALEAMARSHLREGNHDKAEITIAMLHDSLPENFTHLGAVLELELLIARHQDDDAAQLSKLLREDFAGRPEVLATIAATLVSRPKPAAKLLSTATAIATPLSEADGPHRAAALAVLARAAFQGGDKTRAIDLQTKAAAAAPDDPAAAAALEAYRQDRLP
jgi:thiol-disulfide isomerase/thioredoxin